MIVHLFRAAALVLTVTVATACNSQRSDNAPNTTDGTADSIPAADASTAAEQPAPLTEALTPPPASAPAAANQASKDALAEQKAINERQAEKNAQLQQELERLKPRVVTLPAGTVVPVRTIAELSTKNLTDGATFEAQLDQDLVAGNVVVAKAGSRVNGVVVTSDPGGKVKGVASLTVGARAIVGTKNTIIAVKTDSYTVEAKSTKKKDAVRTGVATGVGAVIGGIAGGGKGAAIGAGVGAGAGVATNAATRGDAAVIPAEQLMELKLTAPVSITIQP
jgi:hypothetical protein